MPAAAAHVIESETCCGVSGIVTATGVYWRRRLNAVVREVQSEEELRVVGTAFAWRQSCKAWCCRLSRWSRGSTKSAMAFDTNRNSRDVESMFSVSCSFATIPPGSSSTSYTSTPPAPHAKSTELRKHKVIPILFGPHTCEATEQAIARFNLVPISG